VFRCSGFRFRVQGLAFGGGSGVGLRGQGLDPVSKTPSRLPPVLTNQRGDIAHQLAGMDTDSGSANRSVGNEVPANHNRFLNVTCNVETGFKG